MPLFRRRGADGSGAKLQLYYASDIHGTEVLWRKFLHAPEVYGVPVIIMGGDVVASREFTVGATSAAPARDAPDADGEVDAIIHAGGGAETIETGRLASFNGTYYTLMNEHAMPVRVLKEDVISLLIGGIGEGTPPDAEAGSIVLSDGTIVRGEVTRFDGEQWMIRKPDGTTATLTRNQVWAVVVK